MMIKAGRLYRSCTSTLRRAVVLILDNAPYEAGPEIKRGRVVLYVGISADGTVATPGRLRFSSFEEWAGEDLGPLEGRYRAEAEQRCRAAYPSDFWSEARAAEG